jgi:hypothetical protein
VFNLEFLEKADEFETRIEAIPDIKKAISMNDYIKIIANFWEPDEGMVLPESNDDLYDYLDLAPSDIGTNLFNSDSTKYRITCRVGNIRSKVAESLRIEVQDIFNDVFKGGRQEVLVSGSTLLALRTQGFLIKDLTASFILAFIIIFISMIMLFRSMRLSIISILPTVIAVDGLSFIPENPIIAAAAISGMTVGRIEIIERRIERNSIIIDIKIIINARIKLAVRSLIKNPWVLKARSVLPETSTSCLPPLNTSLKIS